LAFRQLEADKQREVSGMSAARGSPVRGSGEARCPFDRLPDSILSRILILSAAKNGTEGSNKEKCAHAAILGKFQTVCHRFRTAVLQSEHLCCDLVHFRSGTSEGRLLDFLHLQQHIRSLVLWADLDKPICSGFLTAVLPATPNLERFTIEYAQLCGSRDIEPDGMTQQLLESLSKCRKLSSFMINECRNATLQKSLSRKQSFKKLAHLDIFEVGLSSIALESIMDLCPVITSFKAYEVTGLEHAKIMSDSLQSLVLTVTTPVIVDICAPQILKVRLENCANLCINAPTLLSLEIEACTLTRLQAWKIEKLILNDSRLEGNVLPDIREVINMLQFCESVKTLAFSPHLKVVADPPGNNVGLVEQIQKLKHLEDFTISREMAKLLKWPVGSGLPRLQNLMMHLPNLPTDVEAGMESCVHLVKGSPRLKVLHVGLRGEISKKVAVAINGFILLQKRLPNLDLKVSSQ
jgi:hypothetical protein